ncbi:MAG: hypothetical protein KDK34_04515, partial [Leptospiraceae bacterium]|nr:hypothetical protein [Leptospiraceae bacterium]
QIRRAYFANLANEYLEKVSNLSRAFHDIGRAADLSEERAAQASTAQLRDRIRSSYDAGTDTLVSDLSAIISEKQDAQSRQAQNGSTQQQSKYAAMQQTEDAFARAAKKFGEAGRRRQMKTANLTQFVQNTFNTIRDDLNTATTDVNSEVSALSTLQDEYAALQGRYADRLNDMSSTYRDYTAAQEDRELRLAVKEWAQTPYLEEVRLLSAEELETEAANETEASVLQKYAGDAQEEYELAVLALESAQERLKQAGYGVQIEDQYADFAQLIDQLEQKAELEARAATAGLTTAEQEQLDQLTQITIALSDNEKERLQELRKQFFYEYEGARFDENGDATDEWLEYLTLKERDLYARHADEIAARKEHIKHTMRMIRLQKAEAILTEKIERQKLIVQEKEKQFNQKLDEMFGSMNGSGATLEYNQQMRNAVYQRLAGVIESGGSLYNEFQGWYWGQNEWANDIAVASWDAQLYSQVPFYPLGALSSLEILRGFMAQSSIPPAEREAMMVWMSNGGHLMEYEVYKGAYWNYLQNVNYMDYANWNLQLVLTAMQPVLQKGWYYMATILYYSIGQGMVNFAYTQIGTAMYQQIFAMISMGMADAGAHYAAGPYSVLAVRQKQLEYEDALAELDYLTKAPNLQTVKERLIQHGAQNNDPTDGSYNLYKLTEADLEYLFETVSGTADWRDSNNSAYIPDAEVEAHGLEVNQVKEDVKYRDSFGRRYNPNVWYGSGTLNQGAYDCPAGKCTRVQVADHAGNKSYRYYPLIDENAPEDSAYSLGDVMRILKDHGEPLR